MRDPRVWLAVLVGGALGTLLRLAAVRLGPSGYGWPWATLGVNLAGAAVLAGVAVHVSRRPVPDRYVRPLLGTGLCGGLTTFSGMQMDALRMLHDGRAGAALAYLLVSLVGGLVGVAAVARVLGVGR